jgi:putative ABC transport system permease protein
MTMLSEWRNKTVLRFKALFYRKQLDRDLEDEVAFHLSMAEQKNLENGLGPKESFHAARRQFGNYSQTKERSRDMWTFTVFEGVLRDIRFGVRMLLKNPGFSVVAVLTLALGIGANTAIFSVINGVLLSPLPYKDPDRIVAMRPNDSPPNLVDIQRETRSFSQGGGINVNNMDYTSGTEPMQVRGGYVNAGFLETLGVPPMLGRILSPEEDVKGGPRFVVLSYPFWQNFLSSDPQVLGQTISLSGNDYTVIGVMPANFVPPREHADVFVSLSAAYPDEASERDLHFMHAYWRLNAGVTLAQAQAEMSAMDHRLAELYPDSETDRRTVFLPLQESVTGKVRPALLVLFGAVGFVLLIACANFAGLLMARAVARRQELVIRTALGAGKSRLIRQALTESVLLAIVGGGAGLLLARLGISLLLSLKPAALDRFNSIHLDAHVLFFVFGISLLTGIVFGIAPAWSVTNLNSAESLKDGARGSTSGQSSNLLRKLLVTAQFAIALVLLVGAGLLIKGFSRLRAVSPGFNPQHVMTMHLQLPEVRYPKILRQTQFRVQALERINALPGVQAAMVMDLPLAPNFVDPKVVVDGGPPVAVGAEPRAQTNSVMGDYFHVMQIPIRAGREFTPMDREGQPLVAIVNEKFVKERLPHRNPIGARIDWARAPDPPRWMTIVGVAADVKDSSLDAPADPAVYTPFSQSEQAWRRWMTLVLRTSGPVPGLVDEVKKQVWSVDSQIPVSDILSMEDLMAVSLAQQRFNMLLLALFAALALILAAVGIYGLMAYAVSQRTHEIGVRLAIGAQRRDVLHLVLRDGAKLTLVGIAIGIIAALALTRLMASLLFEVTPTDPATFSVVTILLAVVAFAACYLPARRATRVDPMVALRYD